MHITCLEINNLSDISVLDLSIGNDFNVDAASMKEVNQSVTNAFCAYYDEDIMFDELVKSLEYYSGANADFIILTQQQIDYLNLMNDAITVGRKGQQIHLLKFSDDSLQKVFFNV